MTEAEIDAASRALQSAEESGRQIGLLSLAHPAMTMDDAYAVQQRWVARKCASGRKVIGHKIGLTSKAMQAALSIDTPDSGVLLDDMVFPDGAAIPAERFIQPRIEAEIAFVMGKDLAGPETTPADVIAATRFVQPALEILDTRILRVDPDTGTPRRVYDTIADNAANAGLVLGGRKSDPRDVDLRWMGAIVTRNAEVEETGLGAGVLGDPALSVAWLVNRLAEYGGRLRAGEIVLAGSFIRPIEARPDDTVVGDFGDHGTVTCSFARP